MGSEMMEVDEQDRVVGMDDLVEEVCWHLLAGSRLCRIAFVVDDEPCVLPVNYAMRGKAIVFRTATGSTLHTLGNGASVAVEVDHVDHAAQTGWSVLARGHLWEISDEQAIGTFAEGAVSPWAPGRKDEWMWVLPHAISGRAISRRRASWRLPYMPPD